jgi:hypothetical protein
MTRQCVFLDTAFRQLSAATRFRQTAFDPALDQLDLFLVQRIAKKWHTWQALASEAPNKFALRCVSRQYNDALHASRHGRLVAVQPETECGAMRRVAVGAMPREYRAYVTPAQLPCVVGCSSQGGNAKQHKKDDYADV